MTIGGTNRKRSVLITLFSIKHFEREAFLVKTLIYFLNLWAIGALVMDSATQLNLRRCGLRTQFDHAPSGSRSMRKTNTN